MQRYQEEQLLKALENHEIPVYCHHTVVVGSGCAAFNAADTLYDEGVHDVVMVTEGIRMGTSRNTGSDKQTYYKLSLASSQPDSVYDMAQTLFEGGCMHGDTALIEASLSTRCFFKLVQLGVPFPHDAYGQYVGYKTDHDPKQRATSCGPLTSRFMTEALEKSVSRKGIKIYDYLRVIAILTVPAESGSRAVGLLAIDRREEHGAWDGLTLFCCGNLVYATGGPSGIYHRSVYPTSQTGSQGVAFAAGAGGTNLTEWQYGIASTKFRWNLSGTYQQVLPRYISTDENGEDAREFLSEHFRSESDLLTAIFLKGYQWPFDPRKLGENGSSLVDMAVYQETVVRGRRVFLDYTRNPAELLADGIPDFSKLREEAGSYLKNSGALQETPIQRLRTMNEPAYQLYLSHGIDLEKERLEIAVCAQHNNGGLTVDAWWQSNLKHFFPVGECAGTFGVYRPGGTALNSTQVGSLRAAQYIAKRGMEAEENEAYLAAAKDSLREFFRVREELLQTGGESPAELRRIYQEGMDRCAAFVRRGDEMERQVEFVRERLLALGSETAVTNHGELVSALINRDILLTQLTYLNAMLFYVRSGGESRGSYLVEGAGTDHKAPGTGFVEESTLNLKDLTVENEFLPVRPIPKDCAWFENVYNNYREGRIMD